MSYCLVEYKDAYLDDILRVERALWSPDLKTNRTYFEWKYLRNPFMEGPRIFLVLHRGELVGVRGFHGSAWRVRDDQQQLVMPLGGDTVVAPEHQGRGLFKWMNGYAAQKLGDEGFEVLGNFSAGLAPYFMSIRQGWSSVGRYRPLQWLRKESGQRLRGNLDGGIEITSEPRPAMMAAFAAGRNSSGTIRPRYDESFIEWRYRNPLSRYTFLFAGAQDLEGYMALQRARLKAEPEARIVDWACRNVRVFERLLHTALREIGTEYVTTWSATVPDNILRCLEQAGFRTLDDSFGHRGYRPGPLLTMTGADSQPVSFQWRGVTLTNMDCWHLRMICSDGC